MKFTFPILIYKIKYGEKPKSSLGDGRVESGSECVTGQEGILLISPLPRAQENYFSLLSLLSLHPWQMALPSCDCTVLPVRNVWFGSFADLPSHARSSPIWKHGPVLYWLNTKRRR